MTYEAAIARITEISALLERSDTPLDKSLSLYEEGVSLIKYAEKLLCEAERRVNTVTGEGK